MLEIVNSVFLVIVFLVPGFVFRSVEGQFIYLDKRLEWQKFALGLLTRSTFVYSCFSPFILQGWEERWHETYFGLAAAFLFAIPAAMGFLIGVIRQKKLIPDLIRKMRLDTFEKHHIPTAWDYLFSEVGPTWVIVTLKDGTKYRGFFGPDSYVSSDPDERDLYISHAFIERGKGEFEIVPNTKGIYFKDDAVSIVELIEHREEPNDAQP